MTTNRTIFVYFRAFRGTILLTTKSTKNVIPAKAGIPSKFPEIPGQAGNDPAAFRPPVGATALGRPLARRFAPALITKPERSSAPGREAALRPLGRPYSNGRGNKPRHSRESGNPPTCPTLRDGIMNYE
ncbi:MAG: hypothetical protein LBE35_06320 [Clostridiales bacterium]|nr:hypothetical protein [Clostridiales bacterium]